MKDTKFKNKIGLDRNKLYEGEYDREKWRNIIKFMKSEAKRKKITQMKISELTGIPQPNVSRFFKAEIVPNLDTFISVSDALGLFFSPKVWKGLSNHYTAKENAIIREKIIVLKYEKPRKTIKAVTDIIHEQYPNRQYDELFKMVKRIRI